MAMSRSKFGASICFSGYAATPMQKSVGVDSTSSSRYTPRFIAATCRTRSRPVSFTVRPSDAGARAGVAADHEHVLDAQIVQLDQRVLGLLAREPFTQDVRHRIDVEAMLDGRAHPERAGRLASPPPAPRSVGKL